MSGLDLSKEEVGKILGFLGYGNLAAKVWFIGIEEGLGKMEDEEPQKNLKSRANFDSIMDLQMAHQTLLENGRYMDLTLTKTFTPVWLWMAKIMRAFEGAVDWRDKEKAKEYIKAANGLGRSEGDTFLTELSPIPEHNNGSQEYLSRFEAGGHELDKEMGKRLSQLKQILVERNPELVICYGSRKRPEFEKLLDVGFQEVLEDGSGRAKLYRSGDSKCLLLPFLGNGQMSHYAIERMRTLKLLARASA